MMNQNIAMLYLLLIYMIGSSFTQFADKTPAKNQELKTVRLHIDGFSKSKSGAV